MTKIRLITKPTILVFIDWFWPGYLAGGPVQSVLSLVSYLGSEVNFKIVTTNCDLNSQVPYPGIETGKWTTSTLGCEVYYAEPKTLNADTIKKIIDDTAFDGVYINSFFSKYFSIIPLQLLRKHYPAKPVILAPRGMLGPGALALKKYKKKAFILYSKLTGLHSAVTWHATSAQEEEEIRAVFHPKKKICVIANLPKKLHANTAKIKNANSLNLCFVSRISEKKNLLFALEILREIKNVSIRYNIYGPLEDPVYWAGCQKIMAQMPGNIQVNYKGSFDPKNIEAVFTDEHFLFLPTFNENYGHAIVESLLCGCPVIISDQTPWNDLEANSAGYAISLNNRQKFTDAIIASATLTQAAFSEKCTQAIGYISKKIKPELILNQYNDLFNECNKN